MKKLPHPSNWKKNDMAGEDWLKRFRRRKDNLSPSQPESTSRARAMAFNKTKVNTFFENVKQALNSDKNVFPRSVWNLDKTGLTTVTKSAQVLAEKESKQVGRFFRLKELKTLPCAVASMHLKVYCHQSTCSLE